MEIQEKNVLAAYNVADESGKNLLRTLFPAVAFDQQEVDNRPITERVKTLEDAIAILGENHPLVAQYRLVSSSFTPHASNQQLIAYAKLQVIVAALNEGWEPQFTEEEYRWCPWYYLYTEEELAEKSDEWKKSHGLVLWGGDAIYGACCGLACAHSYNAFSDSNASIGARLCLKNESLANYCGVQFSSIWADFYVIHP